jgi:hypothetical protein
MHKSTSGWGASSSMNQVLPLAAAVAGVRMAYCPSQLLTNVSWEPCVRVTGDGM